MQLNRSEFFNLGFVVIRNAFDRKVMCVLEREYDHLIGMSIEILQLANKNGQTLSEYYQNKKELIVVPEKSNPSTPCRFEYIQFSSRIIARYFINPIIKWISTLMGESFVLFKDKCNVKNPGGGGFGPHQDFAAYRHFLPKYHVTAALLLDDSYIDNGCLYMASDYKRNLPKEKIDWVDSKFGPMPLFEYYISGDKNGDIHDGIANSFEWIPLEGRSGDIILFDSFVPHRSYVNTSLRSRRNFFFTCNAQSEGSYYDKYYEIKRSDFANPKFHVSTPTAHSICVDPL